MTTCTCKACKNIPNLDLKFILHHGDYIVQQVRGIRELVGSDVNLIHRLAKNHVTETTGWRAYLLMTESCLAHLDLNLEGTQEQMESYEYLGNVKTINMDMHRRYHELKEARRVFLSEKDADVHFFVDFPTPPAVTWGWLQDPNKRNAWSGGRVHWYRGDRPKGRAGSGASNHCAHGKTVSTEVMLDWHPFEYSTVDTYEHGKKRFSETFYLEPLPNGGTRVHNYSRIIMPLPRRLRRIVARVLLLNQMKYDQMIAKAAQFAEEEYRRFLNQE
jgi:hypothetical protein